MFDQFLRERLSKTAFRLYTTFALLPILWHVYGMFDNSGIVGFLNYLQAPMPADRYYPFLSFVIAAVLTLIPAAGIGFLYDALFSKKESPQ